MTPRRQPAGSGKATRDPVLRVAPLHPSHRTAVVRILRATGFFRATEIDVAREVLDAYFASPDRDYTALGAFTPGGDLVGYVCYGPTPGTSGTYDLYWIAVAPGAQRRGVGTTLLLEVERRLAQTDARLVIIETSSLPLYEPTRGFYERHGYEAVARVPDFYADGDDRLIYTKRIQEPIAGQAKHGEMARYPAPEHHHRRRTGGSVRDGEHRSRGGTTSDRQIQRPHHASGPGPDQGTG